jgi:hypothetical protein
LADPILLDMTCSLLALIMLFVTAAADADDVILSSFFFQPKQNFFRNRMRQIMAMRMRMTHVKAITKTTMRGNGPKYDANNDFSRHLQVGEANVLPIFVLSKALLPGPALANKRLHMEGY